MNLLEETNRVLSDNGKVIRDIRWVGTQTEEVPIDDFLVVAAGTEYNNGFGAAKIAVDLLIVGDDWWMERHEYDGSEWWEYKEKPARPTAIFFPNKLVLQTPRTGWETLREVNTQGEKKISNELSM